nr:hypothetical protein [bacterium]
MGAGARAVYLKNYLLSNGFPVEGSTVKEVVANFDDAKRFVKVPRQVEEKVDLYRGMGGNRWTDELRLSRLEDAKEEVNPGPTASKDSFSPEPEETEGERPQLFPQGDDGEDSRPYFIRNYSYAFHRILWGNQHPKPAVDFSSHPYLMDQYGFVTMQKGKELSLGAPVAGDAVLVLLNPETGIAGVARIPHVSDLESAMELVRNHAMTTYRRSPEFAGRRRHIETALIESAVGEIESPYEYLFARMVKDHEKLVPDGDGIALRGALLFISDGKSMHDATVADIIGAAHLAGISVVDIASEPPWTPGEKSPLVFESVGGRLLKGGELLISAENDADLSTFLDAGFSGRATSSAKKKRFGGVARAENDRKDEGADGAGLLIDEPNEAKDRPRQMTDVAECASKA